MIIINNSDLVTLYSPFEEYYNYQEKVKIYNQINFFHLIISSIIDTFFIRYTIFFQNKIFFESFSIKKFFIFIFIYLICRKDNENICIFRKIQ